MLTLEQLWQTLWNAGIPLFLLAVGIVVIWRQWREDIAIGNRQRDEMVLAIKALSDEIKEALGPKS